MFLLIFSVLLFLLVVQNTAPIRARFLWMTAARSRFEAVPHLVRLTGSADAEVRKSAWAGLASLGAEDDLAAIAAAAFAVKDGKEQAGALAAVRRICAQARDKAKCFDVLSGYYGEAAPAAKGSILEMGVTIGTPAALELERAALKSGDRELYGKALRALAAWENAAAAGDLLDLAQSAPTETERLLALRGYINIAASKEVRLKPAARMDMLKKADALATRADEKRLVMGGLVVAANADALNMAGQYLEDEGLRKEAERASLDVIKAVKQKHPAEVKALAEKLLASKSASVAARAKDILDGKGN